VCISKREKLKRSCRFRQSKEAGNGKRAAPQKGDVLAGAQALRHAQVQKLMVEKMVVIKPFIFHAEKFK
jgi:hypothetical protein